MPSFGNTDISHNNKYYLFQITVETKLGKAIYMQTDQSGNWFRDQYYYQLKYCFMNLVSAQQM